MSRLLGPAPVHSRSWNTPRILLAAFAGFGLLLPSVFIVGCGGSNDNDGLAKNEYEVVEDDAGDQQKSTPAAESSPSGSESANAGPGNAGSRSGTSGRSGTAPPPAANNSAAGTSTKAPKQPAGSGAPTNPATGTGSSRGSSQAGGTAAPPTQPPSLSADQLNSYEVPEGTPEQMLDFIASVDASIRQITTVPVPPDKQALVRERIRQALLAKEKAGGKAYAESTRQQIKFVAAQAKLEAMLGLVGMGDKTVTKRVVAFAETLRNSTDPRLIQQGRQLMLSIEVGKLSTGQNIDLQKLIASFDTLLSEGTADAAMVDTIQNTVAVLNATGNIDEAMKLLEMSATKLQQSEQPEVAQIGHNFAQQVAIQKLDFPKKVAALMQGETPEAKQAYLDALKAIEQLPQPGDAVLYNLTQALQPLEFTGRFELCRTTCSVIVKIFGNHPDPRLQKAAQEETKDVLTRLDLIGKPLKVDGLVTADGKPFDWNAYRGKVVLIDFWVSRAPQWEQQLPEFKKIYEEFHPLGLEVVGIGLDQDRSKADAMLKRVPLPWTIAYSADPNRCLVAEAWRVQAIPFSLLVDGKGSVVDLYLTPQRLRQHLEQMLKQNKTSQWSPRDIEQLMAMTHVVGFSSFPSEPPEGDDRQEGEQDSEPSADLPAAVGNPYSIAADADPKELAAYLLEMADKPKSIRARRPFKEAIIEAADRLLAKGRNNRDKRLALTTLFETLHELAFDGDAAADERLAELAKQHVDDPQSVIARQARVYWLEHRALNSGELDPAQVAQLLDDLYDVFTQLDTLDGRHLRAASATVRAINQLEDAKAREAQFQRFGKLFAGSSDIELKRYGRKLTKPLPGQSELVGKEFELDGMDDLGVSFDWKSYRGKLVLIDFWATWCGPCRREMPQVKQLYDQWHQQGFEVVGVNLDKDSAALAKYLEENSLPWSQVVGEGAKEAAKRYGVRSIPTMMLVDAEGKIVAVAHKVSELAPQIAKRLGGEKEQP